MVCMNPGYGGLGTYINEIRVQFSGSSLREGIGISRCIRHFALALLSAVRCRNKGRGLKASTLSYGHAENPWTRQGLSRSVFLTLRSSALPSSDACGLIAACACLVNSACTRKYCQGRSATRREKSPVNVDNAMPNDTYPLFRIGGVSQTISDRLSGKNPDKGGGARRRTRMSLPSNQRLKPWRSSVLWLRRFRRKCRSWLLGELSFHTLLRPGLSLAVI